MERMEMKMKVLTFLIIVLKTVLCEPTFGDEFVHIKVHLPAESGAHIPGPPLIPHSPKVIHHFHHRPRRPAKKRYPFARHPALLESHILSEAKKPISFDNLEYLDHAEHDGKYTDTFLVEEEKPRTHVQTFKLIEETKPQEIVETYKVIESKPQHHHHHHHFKHFKTPEHIDTVKVVDSHDYEDEIGEDFHYKHKSPYSSSSHSDTFKVIDSLFDDYKTHIKEPTYEYGPSKKKRVQSVKIVETKVPHQHSHEYSLNVDKHPHRETVEIVETKTKPLKSSSFFNRHQQHDYKYEQPSGYNYKPHQYKESYHSAQEEHQGHYPSHEVESYVPEPVDFTPEDTYLPPSKHQSSEYHHHYHNHGKVPSSSLYDEEVEPTISSQPHDSYLPQVTHSDYQDSSAGNAHWSSSSGGYKAASETYSGIDSYSANHVQGVGSSGYHYPSPYL